MRITINLGYGDRIQFKNKKEALAWLRERKTCVEEDEVENCEEAIKKIRDGLTYVRY